jgi:hypothetical protein
MNIKIYGQFLIDVSPDDKESCSICKMKFDGNLKPYLIKKCQHIVCSKCLFKQFESKLEWPLYKNL